MMKNRILGFGCGLALLAAGPVMAADLPMVTKAPPAPKVEAWQWDLAFGGALMSDYNFRGISQSDRGPSTNAYVEARYGWLYAGFAGTSTKLPTTPTGEFDIYGGFRPVFGNLTLDFGAIYYWYPRERQQFIDPTGTFVQDRFTPGATALTVADTDYYEVYGKASYVFNDVVTAGANVYYSPNWLGTGAPGTYASGTLKLSAPSSWFPKDWGAFVSGEFGHYWLGNATNFGGIDLPDYNYVNAGLAFTYKVFTLDLRYHDTDLSREECFTLTSDPRGVPSGRSRWCGQAFIAKLSFDMTLANLK